MDVRCQCGHTTFKTPLEKPLALYICHCESCRRQSGSAFGTSAIFPRFTLPSSNESLRVYTRRIASGHTMYCYFCQNCGTRLLHATPNRNVVSVKGGCISGLDWSNAIHIWTKNAMVPIPEGSESYSEESEESILDYPSPGQTEPVFGRFRLPFQLDDEQPDPSIRVRGACELSTVPAGERRETSASEIADMIH